MYGRGLRLRSGIVCPRSPAAQVRLRSSSSPDKRFLGGNLAVLQGHHVDLHQPCSIVALGIGYISSADSHLRRAGHHLICGPQALADESRRGGLGQLGVSYGQGTVHAAGKGHPGGIRGQGEGTGQQE